MRWHIDFLRAHVKPSAWRLLPLDDTTECMLVAQALTTDGAARYPRHFGATDCRCGGHLTWSLQPPAWVTVR